jgi:hypothetical protein
MCLGNAVPTGRTKTRRGVGRSSNLIKTQHVPVVAVVEHKINTTTHRGVVMEYSISCTVNSMFACFLTFTVTYKFSVITLDGKMLYFTIVATIRQLLEVI